MRDPKSAADNAAGSVQLETLNPKLETPLHLARIEVGASEMGWFLADENYQRVADALKALGYAHVTLDLAGYRRGGGQPDDGTQPAPGHGREMRAGRVKLLRRNGFYIMGYATICL